MLTYYHGGMEYPLDNTEYRVRELASGLDEVIFEISIHDPAYAVMAEEERIVDRGGQSYLVKQIDGGADRAKVVCVLDLDAWRADMLVDWSSGSTTVASLVEQIAPSGWLVEDYSLISIQRTISGCYTPLEVCEVARNTYKVYFRWDNARKKVQIYPQAAGDPVGAFATRELNLREIQYKGKSNDLVTRLYCYGKKSEDGTPLTIQGATIDGQEYPYPYVEDHGYTDKIISAYWIDERYTNPESLYRDGLEKLRTMAYPVRSYECEIIDLQATNPELYGNLDFSLFTTATLIDDLKGVALPYQVVERDVYPYHPERNEVILSTAPAKLTTSVAHIVDTVENPQSEFRQTMDAVIDNATQWITSGDGYVVARKDENGTWKELLFLDTPDMATAQKVLRINENGIGFSTTGVNGQYRNAWTIDGQLVADFITTGTMSADRVRTGVLQSVNGQIKLDLSGNTLTINSPTFKLYSNGTIISINPSDTRQTLNLSTANIALWANNRMVATLGLNNHNEANLLMYSSDGSTVRGWFDGNQVRTSNGYFREHIYVQVNGQWSDIASRLTTAEGKISTDEGRISTIASNVGDLATIVSGMYTTVSNHTSSINQLVQAYNDLKNLVYSLHGLS